MISHLFRQKGIIMLSGSTAIIITFRRKYTWTVKWSAGPFYRHALKL